jgi:hypothetical protein
MTGNTEERESLSPLDRSADTFKFHYDREGKILRGKC